MSLPFFYKQLHLDKNTGENTATQHPFVEILRNYEKQQSLQTNRKGGDLPWIPNRNTLSQSKSKEPIQ